MKNNIIHITILILAFVVAILSSGKSLDATYYINDDLVVDGDTVLEGTLEVFDAATLQQTLEVQGSAIIGTGGSAGGSGAVAFGSWTGASGWGALAGGGDTFASGNMSVAIGDVSSASASGAAAFGTGTSASGSGSLASRFLTTASGNLSTAFGTGTLAPSYASISVGRYNIGDVSSGGSSQWNEEDPLFEIGNGTSSSNRSNALTVFKDGDMHVHDGAVRIQPQGDIGMGTFDNGTQP